MEKFKTKKDLLNTLKEKGYEFMFDNETSSIYWNYVGKVAVVDIDEKTIEYVDKWTWGLNFTSINIDENEINNVHSLVFAFEGHAKYIFDLIKNDYEENRGQPEGTVDLMNEGVILEDYSLTRKQVDKIVSKLPTYEILAKINANPKVEEIKNHTDYHLI